MHLVGSWLVHFHGLCFSCFDNESLVVVLHGCRTVDVFFVCAFGVVFCMNRCFVFENYDCFPNCCAISFHFTVHFSVASPSHVRHMFLLFVFHFSLFD